MRYPKRFSPKEEKLAIQRLCAGDRAARNALIETNLRLVKRSVASYAQYIPDPDERFSMGCEGLIRAVDTYDPSRGASLATHVYRCIRSRFLNENKANHNPRNMLSMDAPIPNREDEGTPLTLHDIIPSTYMLTPDQITSKETLGELQSTLDALPPKWNSLLRLRFVENGGMSQREVAGRLHWSKSYVLAEERRALNRCRETLSVKS